MTPNRPGYGLYGWLTIVEPLTSFGGGPTDQSWRMDASVGQKHQFTAMMLQRGTADVPLRVHAGDPYEPTIGSQIYLYDFAGKASEQDETGQTTVFGGKIARIETTWDGVEGERVYHLSCVSMESMFDTILAPSGGYSDIQAGDLVTALFGGLCGGMPITLGTVQPGAFVVAKDWGNFPRLSAVFGDLATLSEYVWGVQCGPPSGLLPSYIRFYFCAIGSNVVPAPFILQTQMIQWNSLKLDQDTGDYRNRQILQIQESAFADSSELFQGDGKTFSWDLLRPPNTITEAWITQNTQNSAFGVFNALPMPGDTIGIGYSASQQSVYAWQPFYPYTVGAVVINNGYEWECTAAQTGPQSTSGASNPFPATPELGQTVSDFKLVWTNRGIPTPGLYTWVTGPTIDGGPTELDNTLWGEIIIGKTPADCAQNLMDAINCNQSSLNDGMGDTVQGTSFSFPTWENELVNAATKVPKGGLGNYSNALTPDNVVVVTDKAAGAGYIAQLDSLQADGISPSTAFQWEAPDGSGALVSQTSGGQTKSGTVSLNIGINGQTTTANLYYTPGETTVALASIPTGAGSGYPPKAGWYVQVQYTRLGGDCIICEDTTSLLIRAKAEGSTGKYQQFTSDLNQGNNAAGLQECQQLLQAWLPIPTTFSFETLVVGLQPGQLMDAQIDDLPPGIADLVNYYNVGQWAVQEVRGELVIIGEAQSIGDVDPAANSPLAGCGHYRYTVKLIDAAQIGSWLRFWQDLLGGGAGAAGAGGGGLGGSAAPGIVTFLPTRQRYGEITMSQVTVRNIPGVDCAVHFFIAYVDESNMAVVTVGGGGSTGSGGGEFPAGNGGGGGDNSGGAEPMFGTQGFGNYILKCDIPLGAGGEAPGLIGGGSSVDLTEVLPPVKTVNGVTQGLQVTVGIPAPAVHPFPTGFGFQVYIDGELITVGSATPITSGPNTIGFLWSNLQRSDPSANHAIGALAFNVTQQVIFAASVVMAGGASSWPGDPVPGRALFGTWPGGSNQFLLTVKHVAAWVAQLDIAVDPPAIAGAGYTGSGSTAVFPVPDVIVPLPRACVVGVIACAATPDGGMGPWSAVSCVGYDNYASQKAGPGVLPALPGIRTFDGAEYQFPTFRGNLYVGLVMDIPWPVSTWASVRCATCFSGKAPSVKHGQNFQCHILIAYLGLLSQLYLLAGMEYFVGQDGTSSADSWSNWPNQSYGAAVGTTYPPPTLNNNKYPDRPGPLGAKQGDWPPQAGGDPTGSGQALGIGGFTFPGELDYPRNLEGDARLRWWVVASGGKPFSTALTAGIDVFTNTIMVASSQSTDGSVSMAVGDYLQISQATTAQGNEGTVFGSGEIVMIYYINITNPTTTAATLTVYRAVGQTLDPGTAVPASAPTGAIVTDLSAGGAVDLTVSLQT